MQNRRSISKKFAGKWIWREESTQEKREQQIRKSSMISYVQGQEQAAIFYASFCQDEHIVIATFQWVNLSFIFWWRNTMQWESFQILCI